MDDQQIHTGDDKLWVVSPARLARFVFDHSGSKRIPATVREFRISAIGHYLISPAAVNVRRRLTGCDVHWKASSLSRWLRPWRRLSGKKSTDPRPPLALMLDFPKPVAAPFDTGLKRHLDRLYDSLHPFDSFYQALDGIKPDKVSRVTGICEDESGFRATVTIDGPPPQQLDFVRRHAGRQIDVRLKQAHFADGLFEMRGFDFIHFDPRAAHRLIRFMHDGRPRACVLNENHTISFWLEDVKLVNYLQLFEYCIQHNPHMRESLIRCIQGKATALRLMVNPRLAIDYRRAPLPAVFQEAMDRTRPTGVNDRLIKQNLNLHQVGVSFNAMTVEESGRKELSTHISILHNLRALEPIKDRLPDLFAKMAKRAAPSEEGRFYLLESISGAHHES